MRLLDVKEKRKKRGYKKLSAAICMTVLTFSFVLSPISGYFSDVLHGRQNITLNVPIPQIQMVYPYTGDQQSYTVPHTGYYAIQIWGADGGPANGGGAGGTSGTCSGYVKLYAGDILYVTVGGAGANTAGGWSGGLSYTNAGRGYGVGTGGGGATKVVLNSTNIGGSLNSTEANDFSANALMVAGGGGGGGSATKKPAGGNGGNTLPLNNGINSTANGTDGGQGGLISGNYAYTTGKGGSAAAGGTGGNASGFRGDDGGPGYGGAANASSNAGGGGSGWYGGGGGAAASGGGGGGGSSFIRGSVNGFHTQMLSGMTASWISRTLLNLDTARPDKNGYCIITYLGNSIF